MTCYCGIDVHMRMSTACIIDERGRMMAMLEDIPTTAEGYAAILEETGGERCKVLIENSTVAHRAKAILDGMGLDVTVAHSYDLYRITKSMRKTDRHDAIELAGYMMRKDIGVGTLANGDEEFAVSTLVGGQALERRQVCRQMRWAVQKKGDLKRMIRSRLVLIGASLPLEYRNVESQRAIAHLSALDDVPMRGLVKALVSMKELVNYYRLYMEREFEKDYVAVMVRTIPGFSILTSAHVSAGISDPDRFINGAQMAEYFGMAPGTRQSADHDPRCRITKRGDSDVREMIIQATLIHVRICPDSVVGRLYHRKRGRGDPHCKALAAAGCKMAHVICSVIRSGRPFEVV